VFQYFSSLGGLSFQMGMMFKFFGYQFSKMFYRAKIAEKLFIRKRTKKEFLEKVKKV